MRRRSMWLLWGVLLLAVVAPGFHVAHAGSTRQVQDQATPTHLYIMLIPGLCGYPGSDPYCKGNVNAQARAQSTFKTLTAAVAHAHVAYSPLYFSYHVNQPKTYTVGDTHQSVARSVDALEAQLRAARKRDSKATFDLVGHSLGGVVAASWAVSNGRAYGYNSSGLLRYVNSIVTFDSPLRGISSRYLNSLVARLLGGTVAYSLQPDSETIKEITFFPDSWWRSTGHLHSIANSADEDHSTAGGAARGPQVGARRSVQPRSAVSAHLPRRRADRQHPQHVRGLSLDHHAVPVFAAPHVHADAHPSADDHSHPDSDTNRGRHRATRDPHCDANGWAGDRHGDCDSHRDPDRDGDADCQAVGRRGPTTLPRGPMGRG